MGLLWNKAYFVWDRDTIDFVWDLVAIGGGSDVPDIIYEYDEKKKKKLIKLILKVHGKTITEQKQKEIKQYKIKAKDIRLVVKEVLGTEMIAEGVSF
tara:strand:+ start:419 stop:709 length:291 start_codon:yes stop_codon:yes gene_type:complete